MQVPPPDPPLEVESRSPGEALDRATLQRRAKWGVLLLAGRTVLQQLIILVGNVYLARLLGPREFGAFWIIQFAISFFTLFGDAGFGAALIQKKESATQEELSSVFWMQMLMGLAVIGLVFLAAPAVTVVWPALPAGAPAMLRGLSASLLLTAMRVIPTILMERELLFGRLSFIDLVLTVSFYGTAVVLAHQGYGSASLVLGMLAQGVAALVAAFVLRPWRPGMHLNVSTLRPILRFGLTFQAKHIVGFVNGAVMPLYAGRALGPYALGLVTWSQTTAFFPVKLVEILGRVNFPLLSRLQHDPEALARTLEKTLQVCLIVTMLFVSLILGLGPSIVQIIYGDKWVPALPTLYVFTFAIAIGFVSPVMNSALDAIGQPRVMLKLALGWTLLNWLVVVTTMQFMRSALVFALACSVHVLVGNLAVILVVKQQIPGVRLWAQSRAGVGAAIAGACFGRWLLLSRIAGPFSLIAAVLVVAAVFTAVLAVLDRSAAIALLALVQRRSKSASRAA
ncbi:MAG TPA: oligosaccharide flippase family protein [Polyangiaceae bacterium]|nr:oligosaccharide flippase family protein [Polyangiaceae bacterium]